jgi:hypothetical protein
VRVPGFETIEQHFADRALVIVMPVRRRFRGLAVGIGDRWDRRSRLIRRWRGLGAMRGMIVRVMVLRRVVMSSRGVLGMRIMVVRIVIVLVVIVLAVIVPGMIGVILRPIRGLLLCAVRSVTPMMIVVLRGSERRQRAEDRRSDERGPEIHARLSSTRTSRIMPASM